jgi:autotransporter-associated beta strand protein
MLAWNRTAPQSAEITAVGLALHFSSPSRRCDRRRTRMALLCGAVGIAAVLTPLASAQAQSFTWGGTASTTTTTDYNFGTNWSNPPTGAPPVAATQSAVFDTAGSGTVAVTSGSIAPDAWTFTAGAQPYLISGGAVNFSLAGASGGIIDNANSGQTISISNNIGESATGVQVQLLNNSTLILSGTNSYSGGTTVSDFGILQVTNNNAVGTGTVALSIGTFQAGGSSNLTFGNNFNISDTVFGNIIDANGVRLTLSGNIIGAGQLTIEDTSHGGGRVILTGTDTYSGGTTICSCGTLQLGTHAATGSIVGAVTNFGNFNIVNANTSGITSILNDLETFAPFAGLTTFFNGTSASSIAITNRNGGETDFVGNSSGGNATIVNRFQGITTFNSTSSAGSANITNRFEGETDFFDGSNAGNATILNRFGGVTTFNDLSSATNANITNNFGGSTFFFNQSTAGNATIVNNNNGLIAFGFPANLTPLPPAMRTSPIMPAADWNSMRSRPRATRPSPPTAAAPSRSSIARPAATRSSSPTAPASSISPAVSAPTETAALPPARSRARASITSAAAIRSSSAATIYRPPSAA